MWGKKEMNIHDKEIVGFLYKKNDQLLVLLSSDENNIFFNSVIFFHFNNVSDQNIIFDIYEWGKEDIPNEIIKLFPCHVYSFLFCPTFIWIFHGKSKS